MMKQLKKLQKKEKERRETAQLVAGPQGPIDVPKALDPSGCHLDEEGRGQKAADIASIFESGVVQEKAAARVDSSKAQGLSQVSFDTSHKENFQGKITMNSSESKPRKRLIPMTLARISDFKQGKVASKKVLQDMSNKQGGCTSCHLLAKGLDGVQLTNDMARLSVKETRKVEPVGDPVPKLLEMYPEPVVYRALSMMSEKADLEQLNSVELEQLELISQALIKLQDLEQHSWSSNNVSYMIKLLPAAAKNKNSFANKFRFITQLLFGQYKCSDCNMSFRCLRNLSRHENRVHKEFFDQPLYYPVLIPHPTIDSRAKTMCPICDFDSQKDFNSSPEQVMLHMAMRHRDQLPEFNCKVDWLVRDLMIRLVPLDKNSKNLFTVLPHGQPRNWSGYKVPLWHLMNLGDCSSQLLAPMITEAAEMKDWLEGLNLSERLDVGSSQIDNIVNSRLPLLCKSPVQAEFSIPSHLDYHATLVSVVRWFDKNNHGDQKAFVRFGRYFDTRFTLQQLELFDRCQQTLIIKQRAKDDPRYERLLLPQRAVVHKDDLFLILPYIGKPLKQVVHCDESFYLRGLKSKTQAWIKQVSCGLEALTAMHDDGMVCGAFNLDHIFYSSDEEGNQSAKLFTPNAHAAGESSPCLVKSPFGYRTYSSQYTKEDDIVAATLSYLYLRLWDNGKEELIELWPDIIAPGSNFGCSEPLFLLRKLILHLLQEADIIGEEELRELLTVTDYNGKYLWPLQQVVAKKMALFDGESINMGEFILDNGHLDLGDDCNISLQLQRIYNQTEEARQLRAKALMNPKIHKKVLCILDKSLKKEV